MAERPPAGEGYEVGPVREEPPRAEEEDCLRAVFGAGRLRLGARTALGGADNLLASPVAAEVFAHRLCAARGRARLGRRWTRCELAIGPRPPDRGPVGTELCLLRARLLRSGWTAGAARGASGEERKHRGERGQRRERGTHEVSLPRAGNFFCPPS